MFKFSKILWQRRQGTTHNLTGPTYPTHWTQPLMGVLRTGSRCWHPRLSPSLFIPGQIQEGRTPPGRADRFSINKRIPLRRPFTTNISRRGILWRLKSTEICFRQRLRPDPAGRGEGSRRSASPDPLVGWAVGTPHSLSLPPRRLRHLGSAPRTLTPSALRKCPPHILRLATPLGGDYVPLWFHHSSCQRLKMTKPNR